MKQCAKCQKWKLLSEFRKNKRLKSGVGSWCKVCGNELTRKWKAANPERVRENAREYGRKWRAANPEKARAKVRKWRGANLDKARECVRKWQATNSDKVREKDRKYRAANPEKVREYSRKNSRNRRALKIGNGGTITPAEERWLFEFYDYTCLRCGRREPEIELTLDHVLPLKLGGKNIIENAQPLCGSCNSSKHAKHIDYR